MQLSEAWLRDPQPKVPPRLREQLAQAAARAVTPPKEAA
jgi:hypothetical protein